ncbi:MAG: hypothetical protein GC200_00330 [Tepidisphaera sp.]|nr:hypothetical protein [Tepidisphaera sp.]
MSTRFCKVGSRSRAAMVMALVLAGGSVALAQKAPAGAPASQPQAEPAVQMNPQNVELPIEAGDVQTMRIVLHGRSGGYTQRDNCPVVATHTDASFTGGTYTLQGGFAQGEVAVSSYTLPAAYFPARFVTAEFIIGQQNATVTTTTDWSILIWDGLPNASAPIAEYSSQDGTGLSPVIMGPGTRATNVQVSVDTNDPDQIFFFNPNGDPTHTFSIGFRIDHHNAQTADPCFTAPPANLNAFPATDNTVVGCGSGYAALSAPTENWLMALNCGSLGCPPNGGWTRFSTLQTDQNLAGFCITGCRPRGDWVMRATIDPVTCPPPTGACCFGTSGCFTSDMATCMGAGGTWKGPGTVCGNPSGGVFPGCTAATNHPPVANAGPDQTINLNPGQTQATVSVDGSASQDPDAGDLIASYRWNEGIRIIQDGPAFCQTTLPAGLHTLTLTVTDSFGATGTDTVVINVVPASNPCDPDYNQDGANDQGDIDYLINVIAGGPNPTGRDSDFNQDGASDQGDIDALINVIAGGPCP